MLQVAALTVILAAWLPAASGFLLPVLPASTVASAPASWGARGKFSLSTMSLFPDGSGVTGAVTRSSGKITVVPPSELDNSDAFVLDTMTLRVPVKIIGRTIEYNKADLPTEACEGMAQLQADMLDDAKVVALTKGPHVASWNQALKPYLDAGSTWKQLPWYVAETYVYHRLLEATGFWEEGAKGQGFDIFAKEKAEALQQVLPQVAVRMNMCMQATGQWTPATFRSLLHMALWGNQGDSSLFTVSEMSAKGGGEETTSGSRLLVDETDFVFAHLDATLDSSSSEVHMFNDNSGMEIVSDLALVHFLLSSGKVAKVVLHLKPYPFFVSDAIDTDIAHTLAVLKESAEASQVKVAQDLEAFLDTSRLALTTSGAINQMLASPEPMWCMPEAPRKELSDGKVALVICKGDLMYRKLLGDRTWNTNESFQDVVSYFPSPVLALRTCKSPLAVGISASQAQALSESSPDWMVNGECGMIQFSLPPPAASVSASLNRFEVGFDSAAVEKQWKVVAE